MHDQVHKIKNSVTKIYKEPAHKYTEQPHKRYQTVRQQDNENKRLVWASRAFLNYFRSSKF